jgi:hypothetical protein
LDKIFHRNLDWLLLNIKIKTFKKDWMKQSSFELISKKAKVKIYHK